MKPCAPLFSKSRKRLAAGDLPAVYRLLRASFGLQHWWPGETPFEVMVGAVLTQNTAWSNVEKAILQLKRARACSHRALLRMPVARLASLIRPAGYFNVKARRLKSLVVFLEKTCGGDLSVLQKRKTGVLRRQLLSVNGVGPETADSILVYALGRRSFVIDAYTKRIFSRHRLLEAEEDYESWRLVFEAALPSQLTLYNDFHAQIVRLGKQFCRPRQPACETCPLGPLL